MNLNRILPLYHDSLSHKIESHQHQCEDYCSAAEFSGARSLNLTSD
jgi:hypothetical protein